MIIYDRGLSLYYLSICLYLSISLSLYLSISLSLYLSVSLSLYEAPRRHPRGSQEAKRLPRGSQGAPRTPPEAPRRLPAGSQKAPRRLPGGSQEAAKATKAPRGPWERVGSFCIGFYYLFWRSCILLSLLRGVFERPMILDAFLQATIARGSTPDPAAQARALIQNRENPIS